MTNRTSKIYYIIINLVLFTFFGCGTNKSENTTENKNKKSRKSSHDNPVSPPVGTNQPKPNSPVPLPEPNQNNLTPEVIEKVNELCQIFEKRGIQPENKKLLETLDLKKLNAIERIVGDSRNGNDYVEYFQKPEILRVLKNISEEEFGIINATEYNFRIAVTNLNYFFKYCNENNFNPPSSESNILALSKAKFDYGDLSEKIFNEMCKIEDPKKINALISLNSEYTCIRDAEIIRKLIEAPTDRLELIYKSEPKFKSRDKDLQNFIVDLALDTNVDYETFSMYAKKLKDFEEGNSFTTDPKLHKVLQVLKSLQIKKDKLLGLLDALGEKLTYLTEKNIALVKALLPASNEVIRMFIEETDWIEEFIESNHKIENTKELVGLSENLIKKLIELAKSGDIKRCMKESEKVNLSQLKKYKNVADKVSTPENLEFVFKNKNLVDQSYMKLNLENREAVECLINLEKSDNNLFNKIINKIKVNNSNANEKKLGHNEINKIQENKEKAERILDSNPISYKSIFQSDILKNIDQYSLEDIDFVLNFVSGLSISIYDIDKTCLDLIISKESRINDRMNEISSIFTTSCIHDRLTSNSYSFMIFISSILEKMLLYNKGDFKQRFKEIESKCLIIKQAKKERDFQEHDMSQKYMDF